MGYDAEAAVRNTGVTLTLTRTLAFIFFGLHATRALAQGRITGTVYDSLYARAPLAGATVVLIEGSRYVTSDSRGRFGFDSVPEGRVSLSFMHPVLDCSGFTGCGSIIIWTR